MDFPDLSERGKLQLFLKTRGLTAKRGFDQNFLVDKSVVAAIVQAVGAEAGVPIVEVGAGLGTLTADLLKQGATVTAIESDREMVAILNERFAKNPRFTLLPQDVRRVNFSSFNLGYRLVGNLPYSITGQIIRLLLDLPEAPERIVLMIQKEVADKIMGKPRLSRLAVLVQLFGSVEPVVEVSRNSFSPAPRVDSAVIKVTPHQTRVLNHALARFINVSFANPRQTLANNLKHGYSLPDDSVAVLLEKSALKRTVRAEEVAVDHWPEFHRKAQILCSIS